MNELIVCSSHTIILLFYRDQLLKHPKFGVAKNVIFFMGDGMSLATIVASRTYLGQLNGFNGEEFKLPFEEFPYIGLAKVNLG
jgi:alkaline phosphatase